MTHLPPHLVLLAQKLIEHETHKPEKTEKSRSKSKGPEAAQPPPKRPPASTRGSTSAVSRSPRKNSPSLAKVGNPDLSAIEKLRPYLMTLMSRLGFHALLLRAQALTVNDAPWLAELTIHDDCTFGSTGKRAFKLPTEAVQDGCHLFLAQLLMLMESFIGENLTLQLIREVWPELPLDDLNSGRGEPIEKTN